MSVAAKVGKKIIWTVNGLVNLFVLIVILLLLAFGCYAIWDSNQVHHMASSTRYQAFRPTVENEGASFADLQATNPDVFAWLTVYGTNINYPVVQGQDNIRYVNTSAEGKHSLSGAIFLDFRSSPNFSDFSSILYGHHMDNATMFGEIGMFHDAGYFNARRYGSLYFDGKEHGLEFFAFVHADAYDNSVFRTRIAEQEDQQAYLNMLIDMAVYSRDDTVVTTEDRIVLLSTCSPNSTNGRDILIGKITETIPDDPFLAERTDSPLAIPTIDRLASSWGQAGLWIKISITLLPCLLILLIIIIIHKKRRYRRKEKRG